MLPAWRRRAGGLVLFFLIVKDEETSVRQLSSLRSPFYRIALPVIWIGFGGLVTLVVFSHAAVVGPDEAIVERPWHLLGGVALGSAVVCWYCLRLKTVELRGNTLHISGLRRQITVPLDDVERFSGTVLFAPDVMWSHFRRATELGDKVYFVPPWRLVVVTPHPLVDELNGLLGT